MPLFSGKHRDRAPSFLSQQAASPSFSFDRRNSRYLFFPFFRKTDSLLTFRKCHFLFSFSGAGVPFFWGRIPLSPPPFSKTFTTPPGVESSRRVSPMRDTPQPLFFPPVRSLFDIFSLLLPHSWPLFFFLSSWLLDRVFCLVHLDVPFFFEK